MCNNKRKGITMIEVVVALAVIMLVSAAAMGMAMRSVYVEDTAVQTIVVKNHAEGALDCFRYAEDEGEFLTALQKLAPYTQGADAGEFVYEMSEYTITVQADFDNGSLVYTAVDNQDNEILYSYTYPTGEGAVSQ